MATVDLDLPTLRTSERRLFKECPWAWYMAYRMGYSPKAIQADAAWFGIGVHEALAQWYKKGKRRGIHPAEFFDDWVGDEIGFAKTWLDDEFEEAVWYDARDLGVAMLEAYVERYGKDPQWHILSTEQPFQITITDHGEPVAIFKSRWDGVARDLATGKIILLEHKTASQIVTAHLENDDQGGSYFAVAGHLLRKAGVLKRGEEIEMIVYNFLRKSKPDERPRDEDGLYHNKPTKEHYISALLAEGIRTVERSSPKSGPVAVDKATAADLVAAASFAQIEVLGDISKSQPPEPFLRHPVMRTQSENATQLRKIADEVAWMNAVRDGTLPLIKSPSKACTRCPFRNPCILHDQGSDSWESILRSNFIQRDPYEDDSKTAAA
jgi:hypothetical protein